jgi:hypothetical protein
MSQLAVASPASSTIYMDPPRFGTAQNDFSGERVGSYDISLYYSP